MDLKTGKRIKWLEVVIGVLIVILIVLQFFIF